MLWDLSQFLGACSWVEARFPGGGGILVTLPVDCRNLAALAVGHITPEFYFFKVLRINHKKGLEILKKTTNLHSGVSAFPMSLRIRQAWLQLPLMSRAKVDGEWSVGAVGWWLGRQKARFVKFGGWQLHSCKQQVKFQEIKTFWEPCSLKMREVNPQKRHSFLVVLIWMGIDIFALFSDLSWYTKVTYETFEPKIRVTIGLVWGIREHVKTHSKIQGYPTF